MSPDDYETAFADCPHLLALYRANENAKLMQYPFVVASEFPFLIDYWGNLVSAMGEGMKLLARNVVSGMHILETDLRFVAQELLEGHLDEDGIEMLEQCAEAILIELHTLCEDRDLAHVRYLRVSRTLN